MNIEQQYVKSKQRVADHGEVFTQPREVNAMLDMVKDETERIESNKYSINTILLDEVVVEEVNLEEE